MSATLERKRVVWDETNLASNEEYRKLHPVTMKIDEPKTPYHPEMPEEEGQFHPEETVPLSESTWDSEANSVARKAKQEAPLVRIEVPPQLDESQASRPARKAKLCISTTVDENLVAEVAAKQHDLQFRVMRKAVYADEGTKFKSLLHHEGIAEAEDEPDT